MGYQDCIYRFKLLEDHRARQKRLPYCTVQYGDERSGRRLISDGRRLSTF